MFFFISSIILKNVFFLITPKTMSKLYNIGFCLGMFWVFQLYTGVCLSFLYLNLQDFMGYFELINATTDAENRLSIRYLHISGTSAIFLLIYVHIYKIFASSIGEQRASLVFLVGLILYFMLIIIAFIGYVIPLTSLAF
jgi:ubiquinol-cytochrome c reductase cytochrome b subunit